MSHFLPESFKMTLGIGKNFYFPHTQTVARKFVGLDVTDLGRLNCKKLEKSDLF